MKFLQQLVAQNKVKLLYKGMKDGCDIFVIDYDIMKQVVTLQTTFEIQLTKEALEQVTGRELIAMLLERVHMDFELSGVEQIDNYKAGGIK